MFNVKSLFKCKKAIVAQHINEYKTKNDLSSFISSECPHSNITECEKHIVNGIGTELNNVLRNGETLNLHSEQQKNLLQKLIYNHSLKENIIVHRGVDSISYERSLAQNMHLPSNRLYHNAFVYTSLLEPEIYKRKIQLNIVVPAGTHYLFTGTFSNTCGPYPPLNGTESEDNVGEMILDIGTIFVIDKKRKKGKITIYDVHVDNFIPTK